jgi:hypothetical protein
MAGSPQEALGAEVLKSDPYVDPDKGDAVEFRLTYEGLLFSTQKDPVKGQVDARAEHKREIRRAFHLQLKRLWEVHPYLKHGYPLNSIGSHKRFRSRVSRTALP